MKINKYLNIILFISLIFLLSCGLKTDPKSKDSFEIKVPDNIKISNIDNGVLLRNTDSEYELIVERAEQVDNCTGYFEFVSKILPKNNYIDTSVKPDTTYIYRLYFLDSKINVTSNSYVKTISYLPPIRVENIKIKISEDVKVEVDFNKKPLYYTVYLDDKELFKIRKTNFNFLLPFKLKNTLKIIPFDKFNNQGIVFKKEIINKDVAKIKQPVNISYIINNNLVFLTWDKVNKADGYKIKIADKVFKTKANVFNYKGFKVGKCEDFKISAYNEYFETEPVNIKVCDN